MIHRLGIPILRNGLEIRLHSESPNFIGYGASVSVRVVKVKVPTKEKFLSSAATEDTEIDAAGKAFRRSDNLFTSPKEPEDLAESDVVGLYLETAIMSHPDLQNHPNILSMLAIVSLADTMSDKRFLMAVEFANEGSLEHYLQEKGRTMALTTKKSICADIADGIYALHSVGVVHNDVKVANILLMSRGNVLTAKICDFTYSIPILSRKSWLWNAVGHQIWAAPETEEPGVNVSRQRDIYSYGLLVWYILRGTNPFAIINYDVTKASEWKRNEI